MATKLAVQENRVITASGTPNIAFIKYWGKRGPNLPMNSSISMTLDERLKTVTSVVFSSSLRSDEVFINGEKQELSGEASEKSLFIAKTLNHMRDMAGVDAHALIVSQNSFPTGSGIASSASGGATLVYALSHALNLGLSEREMSITARQISGSACRSVIGGIAKWTRGNSADGSDSYAIQIVDKDYWPELIDIIAIVDPSKKKVSSSVGHLETVRTSVLYKLRPEFAEQGVRVVEAAIRSRDFNTLATAVIRDSNNMHATMLDTFPPIMYLTDTSREIMYSVQELNATSNKGNVAGYTFDAGANAHIITTQKDKQKVYEMLSTIHGVESTIEASSGSGPRLLKPEENLIDAIRLK